MRLEIPALIEKFADFTATVFDAQKPEKTVETNQSKIYL